MKRTLAWVSVLLVLIMQMAIVAVPAAAATVGGMLYSTGGDITVEILPSDAGYTSSLYLFSPVYRFIGTNRQAGTVVTLTGIPAGEEMVFGIYVQDTGYTFKMGPGSRNPDGQPHAVLTQRAEREFDVGFEDVAYNGDWDYDDNIFRFRGALAPEPPPVDEVAPSASHSFAPAPNAAGWVNAPVAVSLTATDTAQADVTPSGVDRITAAVNGWELPCPAGEACGFTLGSSGLHTVTYGARDNAGNVGPQQQFQVAIDLEAPLITGTPDRAGNAYGWYNGPVTVSFTCSDALSGVESCPGPTTLTEGADQSVTGTARDRAGNAADALVDLIHIDQTAPVITYVAEPSAIKGWNNTAVTVRFLCDDALSGVDSCPGDATLTESAPSATAYATDKAGNRAQMIVSLQIDETAPQVTGAPDRAPNPAGWYGAPVTVTFTCADALSGIANCGGPATLYEGAGQSAMGAALDNAGNLSMVTVGPLNVDLTAPTISGAPDRAPNAAGWYSDGVTISFTCADDLSGVASCSGPAALGEGVAQSATGEAADAAGHRASATVSGINVDKTAPVVGYVGNAGTYGLDELISIDCIAADALSGLAASDCSPVAGEAWAFGPGTHSFTSTATDVAGNTATATVTFTVGATEEALCRLVQQWSSKDGVAHSLCVKLRNAARANTPEAKAGLLGAFMNEVQAQSGKAIAPDKAAMLIQLAGTL